MDNKELFDALNPGSGDSSVMSENLGYGSLDAFIETLNKVADFDSNAEMHETLFGARCLEDDYSHWANPSAVERDMANEVFRSLTGDELIAALDEANSMVDGPKDTQPAPQNPPVSPAVSNPDAPVTEPLDEGAAVDSFEDAAPMDSAASVLSSEEPSAAPPVSEDNLYHYSDEPAELHTEENDDDDDDDDAFQGNHHGLRLLVNFLLFFFAVIGALYLTFIYSDHYAIKNLRTSYINTAMVTLNHKWLATAFIPSEIINETLLLQYDYESSMYGKESTWGNVDVQSLPTFENETISSAAEIYVNPDDISVSGTVDAQIAAGIDTTDTDQSDTLLPTEEETFYQIFHEIDQESMEAYIEAHPSVLDNGWSNINIDASGLNESGLDIKTIYGDKVLAINAVDGVLLIRVYVDNSRGVLAVCKNPDQLSHCAATTLPEIGQTAGRICDANNGILSITSSAFDDFEGVGNGGQISGLAVCDGEVLGEALGGAYKRIELRNDNRMYIVDSSASLDSETRDAAEFTPALIIDGEVLVDQNSSWTGFNPRTAIGQTSSLEVLMIVVEGRFIDSLGCSVVPMAELMQKYGCVQALNLDGGTSAIMYYNGKYVTRCSNTSVPQGRTLPTAWVYQKTS